MQLNNMDCTVYICFFSILALIMSSLSLFIWQTGILHVCLKMVALILIIIAFFFCQRQIKYLWKFETNQKENQLEGVVVEDLQHHLKMNLIGNYLFLIFLMVCVLFFLKTLLF